MRLLLLLLAGCAGSSTCDDEAVTETFSITWDQFTRAAGDDGVLSDAECRPFCSTFTNIADLTGCEAGTDAAGDTGMVEVGDEVTVTCTGNGRTTCD